MCFDNFIMTFFFQILLFLFNLLYFSCQGKFVIFVMYDFHIFFISLFFQLTKLFLIVLFFVNDKKPEMYYIINIKQQYFPILKRFTKSVTCRMETSVKHMK